MYGIQLYYSQREKCIKNFIIKLFTNTNRLIDCDKVNVLFLLFAINHKRLSKQCNKNFWLAIPERCEVMMDIKMNTVFDSQRC